MTRVHALLAGLLVWLATGSALGSEVRAFRPGKLGLSVGYSLPMGKTYGDATVRGITLPGEKLGDATSGQIPIQLDLGSMLTPHLLVGLDAQYGFVLVKSCGLGEHCSAYDLRLGVEGQYYVMPDQSVDPWFGVGFGYEWLVESINNASEAAHGFEFLNLRGGADFRVASAFSIGPFLSLSVARFSGATGEDYANKTFHEWLTIGAKGTFDLGASASPR